MAYILQSRKQSVGSGTCLITRQYALDRVLDHGWDNSMSVEDGPTFSVQIARMCRLMDGVSPLIGRSQQVNLWWPCTGRNEPEHQTSRGLPRWREAVSRQFRVWMEESWKCPVTWDTILER
jgi:hypothetical protein